ncbi:hypothetical protein L596_005280 [Steinernema carpocapsae]|uniref:Uncharacterized protein n=1 Tax=Steinernema carpocapsae TaxID=34508 RepID=A0A4U8UYG5_STECR|nr:hypothetical protein L596_005280 [Steinernema carpocapsae]
MGVKQTDLQLLQVPNAATEFSLHVTLRCVQSGTVLGSVLGSLACAFQNGSDTDMKNLKRAFVHGGCTGAMIGLIAGPLFSYWNVQQMSTLKLYDRCYRLRFNNEELNTDRSCLVGATIGTVCGGSLGFVVGVDLAKLFSTVIGGKN